MKILILCLPGIGDALMATPMVKVLRKEMPRARIDVLCMFSGVNYVYKNNPHIDNVYFVSLFMKGKLNALKVLWSFRNKGYDVSILCFPAYRREYHWVSSFIGAKKRISHKFKRGYFSEHNFLDTDSIPFDEEEHHVTNDLNLLKPLRVDWGKNYKRNNFKYDLILDKEDINFGKDFIKLKEWDKKDVVGFHPGSIKSPMGVLRRWPVKNFASLGKYLIKKGKKIVIFAGPEELDVGVKIEQLINSNNCYLANNLKFNQSVGILSQISLLITNDNGFSHLANGLKIPTILLVGPTNPKWCSAYDKKYCKIIRKAKFEPWFRNDLKADDFPPKGVKSGMEAIKVEDVIKEINL
jgi:ADP-heptose:LPS heptosyltransferase